MEVQDDFHLATVDIVTDPSGPNCFVNGIMENTEYYFDIITSSWQPVNTANQVVENIVEKAVDNSFDAQAAMKAIEELKQMVIEMKTSYSRNVRKIDEQYAQKAFTKFIDSLKK
jgi:ubiquitin-protein ligase